MEQLKNLIAELKAYEKDKIIRPEYGSMSLSGWSNEYDKLFKKIEFIESYCDSVDNNTNSQVLNALKLIKSSISNLVNSDETQFVNNKITQTKAIETQLNIIKKYWPHYTSSAIESTGILNNLDIKKEFESLIDSLNAQSALAIEQIKNESKSIINQANSKAKEIEDSVRKTAEKVSVQEAQEQFKNATKHNVSQIKIWGGITGVLIIIFIVLIYYLFSIELPEKWNWQMIYFTIIRVGLLTLISTLINFSLRILKSHLHMHQHNLHRMRLSNSMPAFAESASSKDQRDRILTQLVDSVANFGNSGMIRESDDGNSKLTIDNITNTLGKLKE